MPSDDERNAIANQYNALAIRKLIEIWRNAGILTERDNDLLREAEQAADQAEKVALGIDRGSLKRTEELEP